MNFAKDDNGERCTDKIGNYREDCISLANYTPLIKYLLGSKRPTSLSNDDILHLMLGQTFPFHSRSPVRIQRAANSQKEKEAEHMKYHQTSYQRNHRPREPFRNHNPHQQKTDGDFRKHERQKGLHPVQPAEFDEMSPLRCGEVVFMPAKPIDDFRDYEPAADDCCNLLPQGRNKPMTARVSPDRLLEEKGCRTVAAIIL